MSRETQIGWGDNGVKSKITLTTPLNMFLLPKHSQGIFLKISSGVGNALPPPLEDFAPPRPLQGIQVPQNGCWSQNLWYFSACKTFILFLGIFAIFSRPLGHPGTPWGAPRAPGGPPRGGMPHRYLLVIILIFCVSGISQNIYLGTTSKKNGTDQNGGSPRATQPPKAPPQSAQGPPKVRQVPFFLPVVPK